MLICSVALITKNLKRIIKMQSFVVHLMYPDMAILSGKTSIVILSATLFSVMLCGLYGLLAVVRPFYRYNFIVVLDI